VLAVAIVPGVWGAVIYWLLLRIWPAASDTPMHKPGRSAADDDLLDYQI